MSGVKSVTREGLAHGLKTYGVSLETNALAALWDAIPAIRVEVEGRLFLAVRAVIRDGMDSPGVNDELHAAFYEARAALLEREP